MAVSVQKYIKNMAKSVTYTASDVLSQKFEYVSDFKNENQEVFKEVYHSIKDYRTTFSRVKKTITNNKVMDAARVGYDSVLYSITTGDFYAKQKESEVIEKYGGSLMQGFDMDDDDFDWENEDISTGDKVVATAIKKNSKIGTALTVEAIAQTGKAQMDVSKENTMLLYTQNERMLNKLDNGFNGIMGFLKQNGEQTAKVQNQMNENLNKFMTNVDNNIAKLTKQMDELLEMQRNMYNPKKEDQKKRIGYDDLISRNGVLNIKEYGKQIKKNAFNTINDMSGGMISQLFGNNMGEGSNMLAQFASSPFRMAMEIAVNKALGSKFDKAAAELNTTLEGIVPSIIGKFNTASKKEDSGIMGFLGKIFGIKDNSKESINTGNYNKGAIPFDGITKRAITDVIPYYLRKMTSILTGEQEMVYDFQTGKWTSMRTVKQNHYNTVNSANRNAANTLTSIIESNMGGRKLKDSYESKDDYDRIKKAIDSLAAKIQSVGDFGSIDNSDLSMYEREVMSMLKRAMALDNNGNKKDRRFYDSAGNKRANGTGRGRSAISGLSNTLRQQRISQNNAIKSINEGDSILRFIEAEGLAGKDVKSYRDDFKNLSERAIQDMPMSQSLLRAKDEYGVTLYQYLRDMDISLRYIKANSTHLGSLNGGSNNNSNEEIVKRILSGDSGLVNLNNQKDSKYIEDYYNNLEADRVQKEKENFDKRIQSLKDKAKDKGKKYKTATTTDFKGTEGKVGIHEIMSDAESSAETEATLEYDRNQRKKEDERWKKIANVFGKEEAQKLRAASDKFDSEKGFKENMAKVKDEKFSSKLAMFTRVLGNKINNPVDSAVDAINKVDYWLQNLIYGEDLSESEKKKSLFDRMKDTFQSSMNKIKDVVDKGFEWIKEKTKPLLDKLNPFLEKIFGTKKDGIYEGGLLGNFIGGVQKGFRKNSKDVAEYAKQQALAAKNKLKPNNTESDSSSDTTTSNHSMSTYEKRIKKYNEIMERLEKEVNSENPFISDIAMERLVTYSTYNRRQQNIFNEKISTNDERQARKQAEIDDRQNKINKLNNTIQNQKTAIEVAQKQINILTNKFNETNDENELNSIMKKIEQQENIISRTEANIKKNEAEVNKLEKERDKIQGSKTKIKLMAVGGVNRTGSPFKSVLSAGELHNGRVVPRTGIYNINPGDTVVNPASASVRAKQATNERRYLANIRRNAEANDKLTPQETIAEEATDKNKEKEIQKLMIETDWKSLTDDKQKAEFIGNVTARGLIGGGLGLLVGGPLLGASIGAASSLTKSTNGFANFLFGEAIHDKDGNVQVDEKGNIKRGDNGLISKELMDAVPDIKKFGLGGLVAGLLTPIGPLGGVLAGSALGFAKKSEIFQGSLFGEGGILSDENMTKLKKGAKNMGIGAVIGAFTGPFGLVGNALLGATAGYVTSTDKFKDAILGKKENPDDPESKRHGGLVGTLKKAINPLKEFGKTLTNGILDAIFGKKGDNDKREGGLFGIVRDSVIKPLVEGSKSIVKELKNKAVDIGFMAKKTWKSFQKRMAGGDFFGKLGYNGSKVAKGAMGLATGATKVALFPATAVSSGIKGIGNHFKKKRIKSGRADDMTSRERLKARADLGMSAYDEYSEFDENLSKMDNDSIELLLDRLSYYTDEDNAIDNERNEINNITGDNIGEILNPNERTKLIKILKKGDYRIAENYINTTRFKGKNGTGITDKDRDELIKIVRKHKKSSGSLKSRFEKASKSAKLSNEELKNELGIDINLQDEHAVDNLKRMLKREKIHNEAGLTEEDIEYDRMREFWSDDKSPLKNMNDSTKHIAEVIDNIYQEVKFGNEYDELLRKEEKSNEEKRKEKITKLTKKFNNLSDEEKAKYESLDDYIKSNITKSKTKSKKSISNISRDDFIESKMKRSKLTKEFNNLSDEERAKYKSYEDYVASKKSGANNTASNITKSAAKSSNINKSSNNNKTSGGVINRVKMVNENPDKFSNVIKELVEKALTMFDNLVMREFNDKEKVKAAIDEAEVEGYKDAQQIGQEEEFMNNEDNRLSHGIIIEKTIVIKRFDKTFEFVAKFKAFSKGHKENRIVKMELAKNQYQDFNNAREEFANIYVDMFIPKDIKRDAKSKHMSFKDMIKKSIKISGFFAVASVFPLGALGLGLAIGAKKLASKIGLGSKVKKGIRHAAHGVKQLLGSHDVNQKGFMQKRREKKYSAQAEKALEDAIKGLNDANPNSNTKLLNTISNEKYESDYVFLNEEEQKAVRVEFMNRYKAEKRKNQIFGHGLLGNVKAAAGTIKSGIKNKIAGGINIIKEKKAKEQEQDKFLGKLFSKLDKWRLKKDEEQITGKKDSKLAKILKWLFIGGIAVPIITGFIKEKVVPAFTEKIKPLLEKAGQKLIGTKNPKTGEYEGGLVSGIVNPIRNFFKDKFQTVHDWFHNEGKFTSENSGFKGLINNFINVFKYGVELWKSGYETIIQTVLPGVIATSIKNLPAIISAIGSGVVQGVGGLLGFDEDGSGDSRLSEASAADLLGGGGGNSRGETSTVQQGIQFNNTVGGTFNIPLGGSGKVSSGDSGIGSDTGINSKGNGVITNFDSKLNADGTKTHSYGNREAKEELIADNEMVAGHTTKNGATIYYKRTDTRRIQPYEKIEDGKYIRSDQFSAVAEESLQGNEAIDDNIERTDNMDGGSTLSGSDTNFRRGVQLTNAGIKAATSRTNAKGLKSAIKLTGKGLKGVGKVVRGVTKFIPGVRFIGKGFDKVLGKAGDIVYNSGEGISNKVYDFGQKIINKGLEKSKTLRKINDFGLKIQNSKVGSAIGGLFDSNIKADNYLKKSESLLEEAAKLEASGDKEGAEKLLDRAAKLDEKGRNLKQSGGFINNLKSKWHNSKPGQAVDKVTGKVTDIVNKPKKFINNLKTKAIDKVKSTKIGKTIDKATKKVTDIVNKPKKFINNLKTKAIDKVKSSKVVGAADDIVKNIKNLLNKGKQKIIDFFKNIFKSSQFKNAVKTSGSELTDEVLEKSAKEAGEKIAKEGAERIAKEGIESAGKAAVSSAASSTGIGVVVTIAMALVDFADGMNNVRNIMKITGDDIPWSYRLISGLANTMQDIPYAGILFGLLGTQAVVGFVTDYILPFIMPGVAEDIKKRQEKAEQVVQEENRKSGTNLTLDQYNDKYYKTVLGHIGSGFTKFGSFMAGRDAGVTDAMEARQFVEDSGKTVTKIREKLQDIASRMWEEKASLFKEYGLARESYGAVCAEIIDKIVLLLNDLDKEKLDKVLDSAGEMRQNLAEKAGTAALKFVTFGFKKDNFEKGWNDGFTGLEYLGLSEDEYENTKAVKIIGGVASVFVKSCGGAGLKWKIIDIVISCFGNAIAKDGTQEENTQKLVDNSNAKVSDINDTYNANVQDALFADNSVDSDSEAAPTTESKDAPATESKDIVAANANANDKLSPFNPIKSLLNGDIFSGIKEKGESLLAKLDGENNPFSKIINLFSNVINKAFSGITGEFDKVEDIFKTLSSKNKATNESIDNLSLMPSDKKYWKVELDKNNPLVSGLFNFTESINRVIKAPFALASASLGGGLNAIASSGSNVNSGNNNSGNNNNSGSDNNGNNNNSGSSGSSNFLKKMATAGMSLLKKIGGGILSIFGKGKDDEELNDSGFGDDPFHIYQRDYTGSYRTSGDKENQTIADSGCGPAAAASLLRMYGKKGDMRNAVNYALNNKYKEVDGGTYPQYFNDYLNKNGINTNSNADNNDVVNNLVQNKPVILMGRDLNNSGRTPYGSKYSHYVVARGLDSNGNVIVEDSEDKNGSTRYSLADTLRNSSVRITTGNGKYGRAKNSLIENYMAGTTTAINAAVSNVVGNVASTLAKSLGSSGSNNNKSPDTSTGTNGIVGDLTPSSDVKTSCGYTAEELKAAINDIRPGCSAEQFPEAAIAVEKSKGVNALFTIAVAVQEHGWDGTVGVNTSGGNWGNWNVFNIEGTPNSSNGRWKDYTDLTDAFEGFGDLIMGNTYYKAGLTTPEKIGSVYCPPNASENVGYGPWGEAICQVANMIASHISGKGRGKGKGIRPTFTTKFLNNVNTVISYSASKALSNLIGGNISGNQSSSNNANNVNTGNVNVNIDAATTIICGDSITCGLSATSLGNRAMGLVSGTTDKNHVTNQGSYETTFKANSDIIKGATDAIFFWGMNEVFANMTPEDYFARYQDSIDTILGYGGRSTSDTNIYILPVIWVPDNSGYGGSYTAKAVEEFNEKYIKPFAQKKGYPLVDIYEDTKEVPHLPGDVHPSDSNKLYEIIKAHMGGGSAVETTTDEEESSGSGRGIIDRLSGLGTKDEVINTIRISNNKISSKGRGNRQSSSSNDSAGKITGLGRINHIVRYGKGIWGRDGEKDKTDTSTTTSDTSTEETTTTDDTSETDKEETTSTETAANSSSKSAATGLISLLGQYSKALTKGIFGNFYDALYGSEPAGNVNGSVGSGDAAKMLGKSLTMSRNNGKADLTLTIGITEDEVELYDMLTDECGLNAAVACGVLSNWEFECGINRIKEIATKGTVAAGGGIMQWTPPSKHIEWANANGFSDDPWSWEANKAHAKDEILSGGGLWNKCTNADPSLSSKGFKACANFEEFKQLTKPEDAAVNYERAFEGSWNWDGQTSEAVGRELSAEEYYDNNRALGAKILYEMIVNGKCDESGSGRGKGNKKDKELFFHPRESSLVDSIKSRKIKSKINHRKYGRGIWGRDGEEDKSSTTTDTTTTDTTTSTTDSSTDTTDKENDKSTSKSSAKDPNAKTLISKLATYAKANIKGIYGNFYDALYGSEVEEGSSDGGSDGYTDGSGPIYAAAMVFEAMGKANPTFGYCSCGGRTFDIECRDGKKIEKVRPDCSGMMSAVAQYMGYYTYPGMSPYTDTFFGLGYNVTNLWAYKFCDKDGNVSPDWEYLDFDPNDRRPGDMIVKTNYDHIDMYVFTDDNGRVRGFNAGSGGHFPDGHCDSDGSGIEDSYNFAKNYLDNGNKVTATDGSLGATTIQDGDAWYVVRYKGSGSSGSGRGKGSSSIKNTNSSTAFNKNKHASDRIEIMTKSKQQRIEMANRKMMASMAAASSGRGMGILKSLDEVQQKVNSKPLFGTNSYSSSSNNVSSNNSISKSVSSSYSSGLINNATVDLNQLIGLINVIANNADKMDAVLQLLGTIAVNTENTTSAITSKSSNNNSNTGTKNGLSALRNALNSNSSGTDIVKAVYKIAQS